MVFAASRLPYRMSRISLGFSASSAMGNGRTELTAWTNHGQTMERPTTGMEVSAGGMDTPWTPSRQTPSLVLEVEFADHAAKDLRVRRACLEQSASAPGQD